MNVSDLIVVDFPPVSGVPHFEQYLGAWCIEPAAFSTILQRVKKIDLGLHIQQASQAAASGQAGQDRDYQVIDGLAVVDLIGTMTKYKSSLSPYRGSLAVRRAIRTAADDPAVGGILMRIDSPGGSVAGTGDLADDVAQVAKRKPVVCFCEDLTASAAYWVASQATRIVANPTAMVGSIGTYAVIVDESAAAAKEGYRVLVVKAGQFKGEGTPGTEITVEQLADVQRVIDQSNEQFLAGVARGRRMSLEDVRKIADGRVHVGPAALALGLVDEIGGLDAALGLVKTLVDKRSAATAARRQRMSETQNNESVPVDAHTLREDGAKAERQRFEALNAAFEDKAFVSDQYAKGNSIEQARGEWAALTAKRAGDELAKTQKELAEARAELEKAKAAANQSGTDGVAHGASQDAPRNDRQGLIAKARSEFAKAKSEAPAMVICSEQSWVNGAMLDAKQPVLSADEVKTLAIGTE